jgi:hypothetical protein
MSYVADENHFDHMNPYQELLTFMTIAITADYKVKKKHLQ